jgi:hypothetical protein
MNNADKNLLLEAQRKEALDVQLFLDSQAWKWIKSRIDAQRPMLMAKATAAGVKRDDRMLLMGKLAAYTELAERPAMLMDLLKREEVEANEIPVEVTRELPPPRNAPSIL